MGAPSERKPRLIMTGAFLCAQMRTFNFPTLPSGSSRRTLELFGELGKMGPTLSQAFRKLPEAVGLGHAAITCGPGS